MPEIVQQLVVIALIGGSALYVGRRSWLSIRGRSGGCGIGCASCPAGKQSDNVLIELTDFGSSNRPTAK